MESSQTLDEAPVTVRAQTSILVSVVIVNFRAGRVLRTCLQHVFAAELAGAVEVLVVDNSPGDGCAEMVRAEFPQVRLIEPGANLGFGPGNNLAFEAARGGYVLALNPDAFVDPEAIQRGIDYLAAHPDVGVVGAQHIGADGSLQPSARMFPTVIDQLFVLSGLADRFPQSRLFGRVDNTWWDHSTPRAVDWVVGAFMLMRTQELERVGPFDMRFFLYFEEWDLCRRFGDHGLATHYLPQVRVTHVAGVSSEELGDKDRTGKQLRLWRLFAQALYYRKHRGWLGVATMFGIEWAWISMRRVRNALRLRDRRPRAVEQFRDHIEDLRLALYATRWGRTSPEQPWQLDRDLYRR